MKRLASYKLIFFDISIKWFKSRGDMTESQNTKIISGYDMTKTLCNLSMRLTNYVTLNIVAS
jgi:uncharacterized sodium:solute symporter family permease YidK